MAAILTKKIPRLMIAGTNSGCGKTTVACAVLKALADRNLQIAAFKCGPDYIDPMFHQEIIGIPSFNLDIFLTSERVVKYLLAEHAASKDLAVMEGVMGFYDGLGGDSEFASASHLSSVTQTPVILVVDAKGTSLSVCALVKGFCQFRANNIAGVILNRVSAGTFLLLKRIIEENNNIPVLGYLPNLPDATIESRHLGLVTAGEIENIAEKVGVLGDAAAEHIDIEALVNLARQAPPHTYENIDIRPVCEKKRIAVAFDKAFCFYYADNFRLLEKLGATVEYFSPLNDEKLPDSIHGLILGGGYPEIYAERLSQNKKMLASIKEALLQGLPAIAECGGFMYLHGIMCGHPMVGFIAGEAYMTSKLNRFGYIKLTAKKDNALCREGESIRAHEFHYSESENPGGDFAAEKPRGGKSYTCAHGGESFYAGYPHLHLWGNIDFAVNFLEKCCLNDKGFS